GRPRGAGSCSCRRPGSSGSTAPADSTTASATSWNRRAGGGLIASSRDTSVSVPGTETGPSRLLRETATEGGQPLVPGGADRDHPLYCVLERGRRHLVARLAPGARR